MKICIYGGQYGSEGKGSLAEYLINTRRDHSSRELIAFGENSPNSGHTCSLGKTRNLPAAAYFAGVVVMGPDSALDEDVLFQDLVAIRKARGGATPRVYLHEHASIVDEDCIGQESSSGIIKSISSTGSGSGASRAFFKQFLRQPNAVIGKGKFNLARFADAGFEVTMVGREKYMTMVSQALTHDCVFECSQGTLLDNNWGIYPYVTSRPTLPRVAIERNGLGQLIWQYAGVFRTYPIRTGGPSGPTGGAEITFSDIGVEDEIATVTGRKRRVFEFDYGDFNLSLALNRPHMVAFTHLDYIPIAPSSIQTFREWLHDQTDSVPVHEVELLLSSSTGQFIAYKEEMV